MCTGFEGVGCAALAAEGVGAAETVGGLAAANAAIDAALIDLAGISAAGAAGAGAAGVGAVGSSIAASTAAELGSSSLAALPEASSWALPSVDIGAATGLGALGSSIAAPTAEELSMSSLAALPAASSWALPSVDIAGLGAGAGALAQGSAPQAGTPATSSIPAGGGAGADAMSLPEFQAQDMASTTTGAPSGSAAGAAAAAEPTFPPGPAAPGTSSAIPAPAAAAPNGFQATIQKALDTIGKNKLNTANLGLGALSAYRQMKAGSAAQRQYQGIAGPTSAVSSDLLNKFQNGQVSGADAFAIAQFSQKQKAAVNAYYAKAGLSNSSMHQQALQQVDVQAEGMRQQALQNMLTGGLKAAGVANPLLARGVKAGVAQDNQAMATMQKFLSTLSGMNTPQASTPTGTPSATPQPVEQP